jgi:eukaryotic-like serine/threonine-protein kinase
MNTIPCPSCQQFHDSTALCTEEFTARVLSPKAQKLELGLKIGEYTLEKKIGEGGMGEVWSARQPQINKVVAIKFLSQKLITNSQAVARFVQEARAVNEIQHQNIVDIFSFGELADGRPYFVMELLKGQSLSAHLAEVGPLPFSEILPIFEQVCEALQAGHELNIIHRDLKPDNLFLVASNRSGRGEAALSIKVLDFGIAKLNAQSGNSLTNPGVTLGTPLYMSPEQYEDAKTVGQSSDIYSLGVILFELLTGRTPFYEPGDSLGAVLSRQVFIPAAAPSTMVSMRQIPPEVDAVVLKALAKSPQDRYRHCIDFYDALLKAVGPLNTETAASIKDASPLYSNQAGYEKTAASIDISELSTQNPTPNSKNVSTSHPEDFYSGKKLNSGIPSPISLKRGANFLVFVGAVLCLGLGVTFFFSSPDNQTTSLATNTIMTPASITTKEKVTTPPAPQSLPAFEASPTSQQVMILTDPTKEDPASDQSTTVTLDKANVPSKKKPKNEKKPKLLYDIPKTPLHH